MEQFIKFEDYNLGKLTAARFSDGGYWLATGHSDGSCMIWDVDTWDAVHLLECTDPISEIM